jgi:hypothetical protein
MNQRDLGFSYTAADIDRAALLEESARLFDERLEHLGAGDEAGETNEGMLARSLKEDIAEFAGHPEVYPISDEAFLGSSLQAVPVPFSELADRFAFYWVRFPLKLWPRRHWYFNRIEMYVEFNPDETDSKRRPKAYDIMPKQQWQTLMELSDQLEIHLDESFHFAAKVPTIGGDVGVLGGGISGGIDAGGQGGLKLVVGPFLYRLRKAKIQHTDTGNESVFWRLDGSEFFQENTPQIVTIVQVPREVGRLTATAELAAYRYFNLGASGLQRAVSTLPERLKSWFKGGMPVFHRLKEPWELASP